MRTYTVPAGKKDFRPWQIPWLIFYPRWRGRRWIVRFHESVRYTLPGGYRGWNKGGGVIFSLINNKKENHLWAWRYNPDIDVVEYTGYSNDQESEQGRNVGWPNIGEVVFYAKPEHRVIIDIQKRGTQTVRFFFRNTVTGYESACLHYTRKRFWLAKYGTLWFGGKYPAPHPISVDLDVRRIGPPRNALLRKLLSRISVPLERKLKEAIKEAVFRGWGK